MRIFWLAKSFVAELGELVVNVSDSLLQRSHYSLDYRVIALSPASTVKSEKGGRMGKQS